MATTKKFLDLAGLTTYDGKIKQYANTAATTEAGKVNTNIRKDYKVKDVDTTDNGKVALTLVDGKVGVTVNANVVKDSEYSTVKANAMVQIATNKALKMEAPKFNKKKFEEAVKYALTLTRNHEEFYPLIRKAFGETGVIFVILPNIAGSKTNGATKKIGENIMLMVNDRRVNAG